MPWNTTLPALQWTSLKTARNLQNSYKEARALRLKLWHKIQAAAHLYSDTDSAYSTEAEINYTEHLPRPPCISQPTKQHLKTHPVPSPRSSKSQQITKRNQGTRPSYIPIPTKSISKPSHPNTSTHLPKPSASTRPNTQTTAKQPTVPAPKTSTASTYQQHKRKTPLLPTPPAPARQFYNRNHYKQYIPGPSAVKIQHISNLHKTFDRYYNTHPACSGPANYRYYPQFNTSQDHTLLHSTHNDHHYFSKTIYYQYQNIITGPYQQSIRTLSTSILCSQDHISRNRYMDTFHSQYTW